jgi:hypothetical protein
MVRATRSGGFVVASVMALVGTLRFFLEALPRFDAEGQLELLKQVVAMGDNRHDALAHPCRLSRWREVEHMASRLPCTLVGGSASNFLTLW